MGLKIYLILTTEGQACREYGTMRAKGHAAVRVGPGQLFL